MSVSMSNMTWQVIQGTWVQARVGLTAFSGSTSAVYTVTVDFPSIANFQGSTFAQIEAAAMAKFQVDYPNLN